MICLNTGGSYEHRNHINNSTTYNCRTTDYNRIHHSFWINIPWIQGYKQIKKGSTSCIISIIVSPTQIFGNSFSVVSSIYVNTTEFLFCTKQSELVQK